MNSEEKHSLWLDYTRTRYFLIPDNQNIPTGDFILFNLTGKKKTVALTAIASFEITEEQAMAYLETELNQLIEQIKISEDVQKELPNMLEEIFSYSNIEKCLPKMVKKLVDIEDQIEQNPELLIQTIHEFYTSLSQDFLIKRKQQLKEKRQQEYKKSAKEAVEKALTSFTVPSFADTDWMSEFSILVDKNQQK